MTDTVQVVRPFSGHELRVNELGVMSLFDVTAQEWIGIGVVIELTEERHVIAVSFDADNHSITPPARRLVSAWEAIR